MSIQTKKRQPDVRHSKGPALVQTTAENLTAGPMCHWSTRHQSISLEAMFPKMSLEMLFRNNSRSTLDFVNSCRLWQQPLHLISIMSCQRHSPLQITELVAP